MVTVISWCALDGHCYFLVCPGCSLLFPGVLWMVTVISWGALDGHCYFLGCSGWSLLFPGVLWMVTVISWGALDGHCYFLGCSGWSLLFSGVLWMVTVISWCALDGHRCSLLRAQARQVTHTNTKQSMEIAPIKKNTLCAGAPARLQPQLTTNVRLKSPEATHWRLLLVPPMHHAHAQDKKAFPPLSPPPLAAPSLPLPLVRPPRSCWHCWHWCATASEGGPVHVRDLN